MVFQSEPVIRVMQKLEAEVEKGRLVIREDKMLHADLGEEGHNVYNPLPEEEERNYRKEGRNPVQEYSVHFPPILYVSCTCIHCPQQAHFVRTIITVSFNSCFISKWKLLCIQKFVIHESTP